MFDSKTLFGFAIGGCVVVLMTGAAAFAQPRVEVLGVDSAEIRRTAHRLGTSEERVKQARRLLRRASGLIEELAGRRPVGMLAEPWMRLDRGRARTQLERLGDLLREAAERAEDQARYDVATTDAGMVSVALQILDPGAGKRLKQDWPEPPEAGAGEAAPYRNRTTNRWELRALAERDPAAALERLAELEQGEPRVGLRANMLLGLGNQGRIEDANRLLDEVIDALPYLPMEDFGAIQIVLLYSSHYHRERLPELVELLAASVLQGADAHRPGPDMGFGRPWTLGEYRLMHLLHDLWRSSPGSVEQALARLPELSRRVEDLGGLESYAQRINQRRAERHERRAEARERLARGSEAFEEDAAGSATGIREQIRVLLGTARESFRQDDWEASDRALELAARKLAELDAWSARLQSCREVLATYLAVDGEAPQPLPVREWNFLDEVQDRARQGTLAAEGDEDASAKVARQREWVLAAWLWSDFDSGLKRFETREEVTQFEALARFTQWISQYPLNTRLFN